MRDLLIVTQSCLHAKFWFIGSNQKKKTRKKKDEKIEKRKNNKKDRKRKYERDHGAVVLFKRWKL